VCGLTASGWIDALQVAASDSVLAEKKSRDVACAAVIEVHSIV